MDDGEEDFSSHLLLSIPDMSGSVDEFLRNTTTCTHTHTCNPPGPAAATHTHTCYHTHTQVFSAGEEEIGEGDQKKKPLGNKEAVRKYREKKKARTAYLEEEVKKLRILNRQLLKRLEGQEVLEAEVVRLRSLLVDVRAKIDGELGVYPFQKQCTNASLQCNNNAQLIGGNAVLVGREGSCVPAIVDCQTSQYGNIGHNMDLGGIP